MSKAIITITDIISEENKPAILVNVEFDPPIGSEESIDSEALHTAYRLLDYLSKTMKSEGNIEQ